MSNRRNLLLSYLSNSFKWLPYSFEYLYHSLIPTTIDSKNVKNKAKVSTIYGNSVVENQLVRNGNFESTNGWAAQAGNGTLSASSNVLSYSINVIGGDYGSNRIEPSTTETIISGHKYLVKILAKTPYATTIRTHFNNWVNLGTTTANTWTTLYAFANCTNTTTTKIATIYLDIHGQASYQIGDVVELANFEIIDLTQMFPFDTPTTLTDNRVQALINRGYIPYNTGEIKSVDIGEFETTKADTTALQTISFKYQGGGVGTSHDTMEIGKDNVVFTKDRTLVDLGSLTYEDSNASGNTTALTKPSDIKAMSSDNDVPNFLSNWGIPMSYNANWTGQNVVSYDTANRLWVKLVNYPNETGANIKNILNGYMLEYQLATPQTITIPRKHLAMVDLGTIGLSLSGGYWRATITNIKIPATTSTQANIYCGAYLNDTYSHLQSQGYMAVSDSGMIYIKDSTKTQASDFSGIYLFYETENEVADILDKIDIEAGGTINANWFSWVENQQTLYGDFSSSSGWYTVGSSGTISVSNNVATITKTSNNTLYLYRANADYPTLTSHKYLHIANIKLSSNGTARFTCGNAYQTQQSISANTWTKLIYIASPTTFGGFYSAIDDTNSLSVNDTLDCNLYEVIDLTLAFGSGNEPTDINDPRIQYILNKGYIPTNTNGTLKSVDCEVLTDVDFKMKCK